METKVVLKSNGQTTDLEMSGNALVQANLLTYALCSVLRANKKTDVSNEALAEEFKNGLLEALNKLDEQQQS
jgi:hypothetical protein